MSEERLLPPDRTRSAPAPSGPATATTIASAVRHDAVTPKAPTVALLAACLAVPALFLAVHVGGYVGAALLVLALASVAVVVNVAVGSPADADGDSVEGVDASDGAGDGPTDGASDWTADAPPASESLQDEHCARCGAALASDATHCEDCATIGSWRK